MFLCAVSTVTTTPVLCCGSSGENMSKVFIVRVNKMYMKTLFKTLHLCYVMCIKLFICL
jgi:hypothetical protein